MEVPVLDDLALVRILPHWLLNSIPVHVHSSHREPGEIQGSLSWFGLILVLLVGWLRGM